jgi:hypothetical protein
MCTSTMPPINWSRRGAPRFVFRFLDVLVGAWRWCTSSGSIGLRQLARREQTVEIRRGRQTDEQQKQQQRQQQQHQQQWPDQLECHIIIIIIDDRTSAAVSCSTAADQNYVRRRRAYFTNSSRNGATLVVSFRITQVLSVPIQFPHSRQNRADSQKV